MADNEEIAGTIPKEDIEAAEKLKNEANELFKSKFLFIKSTLQHNLSLYCRIIMLRYPIIRNYYQ